MSGTRATRTSTRAGLSRAAWAGALTLTIAAGVVPAAHAVKGAPATADAAAATS